MRTIIIDDVHGCCAALQNLLEKIPSIQGDRLVLLGDLFDRGPDSWGVYQLVRQLAAAFGDRFTLLRGNHEDYLLQEKLTFSQRLVWDRVGRPATARSFKQNGHRMEEAIPWLTEHCRLFYKGAGFQCVHAGLAVDPVEVNDRYTLLHDHGIVQRNRYAGPFTVVGHIALEVAAYFPGPEGEIRRIPWGEWLPLPEKGILCIDTGCGKGGRLTGMIVEDDRFRLESVAEG